jgi:predicted thioesterase
VQGREKLTDEADHERFVIDEAKFVAKVAAKGK